MSRRKSMVSEVIYIKDELPILNLVDRVIMESAKLGAQTICFLPEKDSFSIFCSNYKKVTPIQVKSLEQDGGRAKFFVIISRLKIMLGMKIAEKNTCQTGSCNKIQGKPALTGICSKTEYGESILMNLYQ